MIIVCSSLFLIFIFTYINQDSKEILYNISENTVDECSQILKNYLIRKEKVKKFKKIFSHLTINYMFMIIKN